MRSVMLTYIAGEHQVYGICGLKRTVPLTCDSDLTDEYHDDCIN